MCRATLDPSDNVVGGGGLSLADIKAFLADHRDEERDFIVEATPEGEVWTGTRWWGADAVLHDGSVVRSTEESSRPDEGYWLLSDPIGTQDVLLIHGYQYDVNSAAADTLEAWANALKLDFDFSDGSGTYSRSQKVRNLLDMADRYRKRGVVTTVSMTREDTAAATGGPPPENEGWNW